jgi:phage terminase large subunit
VLDDPSRLQAVICTRRSGKSMTVGLSIATAMERNPGASCLVIGLTRDSIRKIYWKDVLYVINDVAKLGYEFKRQELAMHAPNGSVCYFVGADSSEEEKRKILGQKFAEVWVDESSEYRIDLRDLVYQTLKPATSDYRGRIGLVGTPGEFLGPLDAPMLFYAVTRDGYDATSDKRDGGWSVHRWTTFDNPHMREVHAEEMAEIERDRPEFKRTTKYLTHYLGKWPSVSDHLVYKYSAENDIAEPPRCETFCIGVDLGFNDATAFVVTGWRKHDPTLYVLSAAKLSGLNLNQVSSEIHRLRAVYPAARIIIDGANKQGVEHMRTVNGLPLEAADKHDKFTYIRMMNTDLEMGRIRVTRPACQSLVEEWRSLEWDRRSKVPRESDATDNHLCDAALYNWRASRHYLAEPPAPPKPAYDSEEAFDRDVERRARGAKRRSNTFIR